MTLPPWRLSAVTYRSCPVAAWPNVGWSLVGGWDGSSFMTEMTYLDLRYKDLVLFILSQWKFYFIKIIIIKLHHVSFTDQAGSGETESAYSWSLQHRPGSPGEYPQQHTSELLQRDHQLPQGEAEISFLNAAYLLLISSSFCKDIRVKSQSFQGRKIKNLSSEVSYYLLYHLYSDL